MMKGYDRPQAAVYILKNLQRTSGSDALLPLDQLVEQMIDADEAYMLQAGILDADGNVSTKVFYEDDEAYEFILNTVAGKFIAELCEQRIIVHNATQPLDVPDAAAVHDALCIAYLIDPTVLKDVRHVHCNVGFRDFCEGQTILDMRYFTEPANCWFAFDGDRFKFADILCDLASKSEPLAE